MRALNQLVFIAEYRAASAVEFQWLLRLRDVEGVHVACVQAKNSPFPSPHRHPPHFLAPLPRSCRPCSPLLAAQRGPPLPPPAAPTPRATLSPWSGHTSSLPCRFVHRTDSPSAPKTLGNVIPDILKLCEYLWILERALCKELRNLGNKIREDRIFVSHRGYQS